MATVAKSLDLSPARVQQITDGAGLMKLLSDPWRLLILAYLGLNGSTNINQICLSLRQHHPSLSHHVKQLNRSGLIAQERMGHERIYDLTVKGRRVLAGIDLLLQETV